MLEPAVPGAAEHGLQGIRVEHRLLGCSQRLLRTMTDGPVSEVDGIWRQGNEAVCARLALQPGQLKASVSASSATC